MKIFGIISTKGGVGKTTLTANLGAILADMGQSVLLIDADPQQTLSRFFDIPQKNIAPFGLTELFKSSNPAKTISKTTIPNLDIALGNDRKSDGIIPGLLRESITNYQNLTAAIRQLKDQYDYVLIDTQGTTNSIQDAVIYAADVLLSPTPPKVLDTREFIFGTVELIKKYQPSPGFTSILGRAIPPVKAIVNLWDRTNSAQKVIKYLRAEFDREADSAITVLQTTIPAKNVYTVSGGEGIPANRIDYVRRGSSLSALEIMLSLVYELEPKLSHILPNWEGMPKSVLQLLQDQYSEHPESEAPTDTEQLSAGGAQ